MSDASDPPVKYGYQYLSKFAWMSEEEAKRWHLEIVHLRKRLRLAALPPPSVDDDGARLDRKFCKTCNISKLTDKSACEAMHTRSSPKNDLELILLVEDREARLKRACQGGMRLLTEEAVEASFESCGVGRGGMKCEPLIQAQLEKAEVFALDLDNRLYTALEEDFDCYEFSEDPEEQVDKAIPRIVLSKYTKVWRTREYGKLTSAEQSALAWEDELLDYSHKLQRLAREVLNYHAYNNTVIDRYSIPAPDSHAMLPILRASHPMSEKLMCEARRLIGGRLLWRDRMSGTKAGEAELRKVFLRLGGGS